MKTVIDLIKLHEGTEKVKGRHVPYPCSKNAWTIGWGHNIDANPIPGKSLDYLKKHGMSDEEAEKLLQMDVQICKSELSKYAEYAVTQDVVRRAALIDMYFNLGGFRYRGFRKFRAALVLKDYVTAKKEMLDSDWARQVGRRATRLAEMIVTGEWPKS